MMKRKTEQKWEEPMESSQRFFYWAFKKRAKHVNDMYNGVMGSKEQMFLNFCSN